MGSGLTAVNEDKDRKLAEEQIGIVFGLYQSKSKGFRTMFFATATFATLIFLIVFYPYVTFRGERYQLEANIATWNQEQTAALRKASGYPPVMDELTGFQLEVARLWLELVNWRDLADQAAKKTQVLSALKQRLHDDPNAGAWARGQGSPPVLSSDLLERHPELVGMRDEPCAWHAGRDWQRCKLAEEISTWHDKRTTPFRYRHPSEVRAHSFALLADRLDGLSARFDRWLLGKTESWHTDIKTVGTDLRDETRNFFKEYWREIHHLKSDLARQEGDLNRSASDRAKWISEHQQTIAHIDKQLESMKGLQGISTPFGELPVGLNELVLLFPLLLATGFLAYGSALADTLRLRHTYHEFCRRQDRAHTVFTREHIALVAPLWLDPLEPLMRRFIAWAIVAVPALLFVLAVLLLIANRLLWGDFMEEARLANWMYALLYLLGLAMTAEGFRRIHVADRAYRLDLEPIGEDAASDETLGPGPRL